MSVRLRPDDVYTFSLSIEVGGIMDDMAGVRRDPGRNVQDPERACLLGAGFHTWLGGWMVQAQGKGWKLVEMAGDNVSFDKDIPTRDLDEILDWFPYDEARFCIYLASDADEIYEPLKRRGEWWTVDLTEHQLRDCRKG